jgi:hypothetical protein
MPFISIADDFQNGVFIKPALGIVCAELISPPALPD